MDKIKLGYCICGSFCTIQKTLEQMKLLTSKYNVIPIVSEVVSSYNTRFGKADEILNSIENICNHKVIKDIEKQEFLIPEVLDKHIKNKDVTVNVIETDSKWYGVTYKEDKDNVKNAINNMIESGEYSYNLWD